MRKKQDDAKMDNKIKKESLNVHEDKGDDSSVKGHTIDAGHESMQRNDSSDSEEGSEDNVKEKLGGRKLNTPSFRTARGGKQPRILLDRGPIKSSIKQKRKSGLGLRNASKLKKPVRFNETVSTDNDETDDENHDIPENIGLCKKINPVEFKFQQGDKRNICQRSHNAKSGLIIAEGLANICKPCSTMKKIPIKKFTEYGS